LGCNVFR